MLAYKRLVLTSGLFDADWYRLNYPFIVRHRIDPLRHFLKHGKISRLSPSRAFDVERYLDQHEEARKSKLNPLIHYLKHGRGRGLEIHPTPPSEADRIVASGLFDERWYLDHHPDVAASSLPALLHYIAYGALEGRSPGPEFDADWYLKRYPDIVGMNPLLHYIDHGREEGRIPKKQIKAIDIARQTVAGVEDLDPELYGADFFEPLDDLDVVDGRPRNRLARAFDRVVEATATPPSAIVFLPWLVHGGADLVAGYAVRALVETYGLKSVLVVLADHDREEAPHLLPEGVPLLSFSRIDSRLSQLDRIGLVDLMVRSLEPDVVLNVNSHACWEATKRYGRKLAKFTRLYAMLFCPDFAPSGRRNGYSDTYLRHCLPFLSGVYFDNQTHIDEVARQFGIPDEQRARLVTLLQPAPALAPARGIRSVEKPLRVLWAGRLLPQKNVELLIKLAETSPQFEFHIWGRGSHALEMRLDDLSRRCTSVHFHGAFEQFQALPLESYDALLYTSLWDGIPNVLLEAAAAGLAIVASHVGGIGEVVDESTGWLIEELRDPSPYMSALQAISQDPEEVLKRGSAMRQRLIENHNWRDYRETLIRQPQVTGGLLHASSDDNGGAYRT